GLVDGDLIVRRIDLNQYLAALHVFVVADVYADHMSANSRTDRMKVRVHLSVIGGFVAPEVTPQEKPGDRQHNKSTEHKEPGSTMPSPYSLWRLASPRGRYLGSTRRWCVLFFVHFSLFC